MPLVYNTYRPILCIRRRSRTYHIVCNTQHKTKQSKNFRIRNTSIREQEVFVRALSNFCCAIIQPSIKATNSVYNTKPDILKEITFEYGDLTPLTKSTAQESSSTSSALRLYITVDVQRSPFALPDITQSMTCNTSLIHTKFSLDYSCCSAKNYNLILCHNRGHYLRLGLLGKQHGPTVRVAA